MDFPQEQIATALKHWREVGTCTAPADRATTEACIVKLFGYLGKGAPTFVWADGPQQALEMIPTLVADPGENIQKDALQRVLWGCEEVNWVGHYLTCRDVCGVKYEEKHNTLLEIWHDLVRASGWWFPLNDSLVVCVERHQELHFDDQYRLHCPDGPAIRCRDGYTVYAWHGTRIPAEWITAKDSMDVSIALTWENIEQRRCAAEILGWDKVLAQLDVKVIDKDADPLIGELLEVTLPSSETPDRFLRVLCGTGRTFALPVPGECQTALEANAWSYNIDGNLLRQLEVRT